MSPHKKRPAQSWRDGGGAGKNNGFRKKQNDKVKPPGKQDALQGEMRAERKRLSLATVALDCIGLALSKGMFGYTEALERFVSLPYLCSDPPLVPDEPAAAAWRAERGRRLGGFWREPS